MRESPSPRGFMPQSPLAPRARSPFSLRRAAVDLANQRATQGVPLEGAHATWPLARGVSEDGDLVELVLGALGTLYEVRDGDLVEWTPASPVFSFGDAADALNRQLLGVPGRSRRGAGRF